MMDLQKIIAKAEHSKFYLWLLNQGLWRMVPFNKPHGFWIKKINANQIEIKTPYKKQNLNHIKGLHACGLATASEYASGLVLLLNLNPKKYRIIMESISVKYHYQGKMEAITKFEILPENLNKMVFNPLNSEDNIYFLAEVKTHDVQGNHLCTATVNWQIKSWEKVKTGV